MIFIGVDVVLVWEYPEKTHLFNLVTTYSSYIHGFLLYDQ